MISLAYLQFHKLQYLPLHQYKLSIHSHYCLNLMLTSLNRSICNTISNLSACSLCAEITANIYNELSDAIAIPFTVSLSFIPALTRF